MLIEEYLQMRIQSAESVLAGEELAGNVPKAMAEKAAIAELRGVEAFLNNASEKEEAELPASDNTAMLPCDNKSCHAWDCGVCSSYLAEKCDARQQ